MMEMGYKQQSLRDEGFENVTENEVVGETSSFILMRRVQEKTQTVRRVFLLTNTTPSRIAVPRTP